VQLKRLSRATVVAVAACLASTASADSGMELTTTVFHESGGPLETTVVTPAARLSIDIGDPVTLSATWEADIVTGASVAVTDAPSANVDTISSATVYDDFRNTFGGRLEVRSEFATFGATYTYGYENDYRSHGFSLSASTELFERDTALELSYGRGFDQVCNLLQPRAREAVDRRRMPDANGCFEEGMERETLDLDIHTLQAAWTQIWTPVFNSQLTLSGQVLDGYQGNPYRGVWFGRTSAQEHHPEVRVRYALGLGLRWWLKPLNGAVMVNARGYRDTWDIRSVTAELAYEQVLFDDLRVRARGRYYLQSGAAFYSDDYARFVRGQYFTGDRELSPMSSITVGGLLQYSVPADDEGDVLGFLAALTLAVKLDYIMFDFSEYRYGRVDVPNASAITGTIDVEATF
jgi:hypothetical protein